MNYKIYGNSTIFKHNPVIPIDTMAKTPADYTRQIQRAIEEARCKDVIITYIFTSIFNSVCGIELT